MRRLPNVQSLKEAVERVIESNIEDHYRPRDFILATQYGNAPNLFEVCYKLIHKAEAVEFIERKIQDYPTLLTLEDFVCRYGPKWHFDAATVEQANASRERFDQVAHQTRYA